MGAVLASALAALLVGTALAFVWVRTSGYVPAPIAQAAVVPVATSTPSPTATPIPTASPIPTATTVPAASCDQARLAVYARHPNILHVLSATLHCDAAVQGVRPIRATWYYESIERTATYDVGLSLVVTPTDRNATRLDEVAQYGPAAAAVLALAGL